MTERVKVVEINGIEYLVVEETKPDPIEFRLYYDENGRVLFYTCDKPEGNYIVIDQQTYVESRYDWVVKEGKLTKLVPGIVITKLKPSTEGIDCVFDDVSILVDSKYTNIQKWKLDRYEL
jgi:hypothetical protein